MLLAGARNFINAVKRNSNIRFSSNCIKLRKNERVQRPSCLFFVSQLKLMTEFFYKEKAVEDLAYF